MTQKLFAVLLALCLVAMATVAQQRFLVGPRGEAYTIAPDESALKAAQRVGLEAPSSILGVCTPKGAIGIPGPGTTNFGFGNGDVSLQRLIAPVTGVIESVYFRSYQANSIPDSSCSIRIFRSAWTAASPGPAGVVNWGGFLWPTDPSGAGQSPYADDPGVTTFESHTAGAFNPNGAEIWGLGGYATTWHRAPDATNGYVNGIAMMDLGVEPAVTAGDAFNVNIRLPSAATVPNPNRAELLSGTADIVASDFMKFYYRGRASTTDWGWWKREFTMNVWAVIRATGNVPPTIENVKIARDTTASAPTTITCSVFDCNFVTPSDTGVASVTLQWNLNGGATFTNVTMTLSAGTWSGVIPAQAVGSTVGYRLTATDNRALVSTPTTLRTFRVINLNRDNYTTQLGAPYSFVDITGAGGGTRIANSAFFNTADPLDDGTAGPFDIGGIFRGLFNRDSLRYAWVGVNGAICLSKRPTDTVRVGSGFANWNPPDAAVARSFIGPFWNDIFINPAGGYGSIWYRQSGTQFIVQWEKVGNFNSAADTLTTFQLILDRASATNPTITFQYKDVGNTTLATDGLVALQDTSSAATKFLLINRFGYPSNTRPRNAYAIKLTYSTTDVSQIDQIPGQFELSANYPNPFNPSTKINFTLPTASDVLLTVHNILGQEVATVVNGPHTAGTYSVDFTANNLSSGVYFYRIKAGNYTDSKKMILMK